jgi:hypothetical protein
MMRILCVINCNKHTGSFIYVLEKKWVDLSGYETLNHAS